MPPPFLERHILVEMGQLDLVHLADELVVLRRSGERRVRGGGRRRVRARSGSAGAVRGEGGRDGGGGAVHFGDRR